MTLLSSPVKRRVKTVPVSCQVMDAELRMTSSNSGCWEWHLINGISCSALSAAKEKMERRDDCPEQCFTLSQRRRSGVKSGGHEIKVKKCRFFRKISEKISFSSQKFLMTIF